MVSIHQVNIFVIECEGIRRSFDLHDVKGCAQEQDECNPFRPSGSAHYQAQRYREENETETSPKKDQRRSIVSVVKSSLVRNLDACEPKSSAHCNYDHGSGMESRHVMPDWLFRLTIWVADSLARVVLESPKIRPGLSYSLPLLV